MLTDKATLTPPLRLQGSWNALVANDTISQGVINGHTVAIQAHGIFPHQQHHALMKMQQGDITASVECQIFLMFDDGIHGTRVSEGK